MEMIIAHGAIISAAYRLPNGNAITLALFIVRYYFFLNNPLSAIDLIKHGIPIYHGSRILLIRSEPGLIEEEKYSICS